MSKLSVVMPLFDIKIEILIIFVTLTYDLDRKYFH